MISNNINHHNDDDYFSYSIFNICEYFDLMDLMCLFPPSNDGMWLSLRYSYRF